MKLFVLRHGEAAFNMGPDSERQLTSRGKSETRTILTSVAQALSDVTVIYASPYDRAQQTAAIASELLGLPVHTHEGITPEGGVDTLAELAQSLDSETPLFVSHQPLVGRFVDWLAGLPPGREVMGTSALAAFDAEVVAADCGELLWLKQPGAS